MSRRATGAVGWLQAAVRGIVLPALTLGLALSACGGDDSADDKTDTTDTTAPATSTTAAPGPPPGSELLPVLDLGDGDCFDTVSDPTAVDKAVWKINCADPHSYEVYGVLDYDGDGSGRGTPYPGVSAVQNWSEQACYAQFEPFVGVRWTISELDIKVWWPSERSWNNNDRGVICTVTASNGSDLTGTQRGVAR